MIEFQARNSDCFVGNGGSVRVFDKNYDFRFSNCIFYRTNGDAKISIRFENERQIVVISRAASGTQAESTVACGPVKFNFRTMNAI